MLRKFLTLTVCLLVICLASCDPRKGFKIKERRHCRYRCPERLESEVCGSDGVTYNSRCALRKASCESENWIHLAHRGKCQVGSSRQSKQPECIRGCTKIYRPVCGSDGRTYGNECMLNATSCRHGNQITKVHAGRCGGTNSCSQHRCKRIRKPVCGTDGKTYSNECTLKFIACKTKADIKVAHAGRCTEKCQIKLCKRAKRRADVCGSDGKTYNSLCSLKNEACRLNADIKVAHIGPCTEESKGCIRACDKSRKLVCGSDSVTYGNECLFQIAVCIAEKKGELLTKTKDAACNDAGHCKPKPCSREMRPVCGNDGHTYANECVLKNIACRRRPDLKLAHTGRCARKCQIRPCTKILRPVCGSDGKTYSNICMLKNEACSARRNIKAIATIRCEDMKCKPKPCRRIKAPVCGSDGRTYPNKCVFDNKVCTSGVALTVAKQGPCDTKNCRKACPAFDAPKCGTDGKTYKNMCHVRRESCLQGKRIRVDYSGPCTTSSV